MPPNGNFEAQSYNPFFFVNEDLKNNDQDSDVNFYQTLMSSLDTRYYIFNEFKENLEHFQEESFSFFKYSQEEQKLWIILKIFRFIMFLIQCCLFITKMVPAPQNFKFISPNAWLLKVKPDLKKLRRRITFE